MDQQHFCKSTCSFKAHHLKHTLDTNHENFELFLTGLKILPSFLTITVGKLSTISLMLNNKKSSKNILYEFYLNLTYLNVF